MEKFKEFWQDFRLVVEEGGDMIAKFEKIIAKAREETITFKSRAKDLTVKIFFEAWTEIQ